MVPLEPTNVDWDALLDVRWVPLAEAEDWFGVSRSALRNWYRSGQIPSPLVDGPFGLQREVPIEAVLARPRRAPRASREGRDAPSPSKPSSRCYGTTSRSSKPGSPHSNGRN